MRQTVRTRREYRRYLLGYPERGDWDSLEKGWFKNTDQFEELSIAEEELIDDYIFGLLSSEDRARFEQHFLCSHGRREKVATSRALLEYARATELNIPVAVQSRHWHSYINKRKWLLIFAAGCLLVVAVIAKHQRTTRIVDSNSAPVVDGGPDQTIPRLNTEPSNNTAARQDSRPNDSTQDVSSGNSEVAFTLLPGLSRSGGAGMRGEVLLKIPVSARSAKFTLLTVDAREGSLNAELIPPQNVAPLQAENAAVWSDRIVLTPAQARSGQVSLVVSAQLFHSDNYTLKLSQKNLSGQWETVERYDFRVIRTN